ncbi:hypothetical protein COW94_01345 [Candidatus Peregrinibacteria bacterium CG22_combo_CG10-13_8_21_14_all_44_10]|nr:MAG: hypothetical protein AUK45_00800 [Candidatus Peregrinibacteria bacterium CG2_30_44_17]PIP66523.1 MAG: hypothetical protein COW94_01345 [Candidatus Peregrinibacteria bacterium CG22_combo_CG10-13_8_21_14_all_44_10]PIS03689.1 MAG: hypothetical protein COT83_04705 [Candidatus Peregrinibacteria bacterium CG10_big_fil_rev_8_21_14_0_10_44_7]PIX79819.1 MAG: hypothetical protein COZ35_02560 [Candidatus Peregrinibacteria bacterium CG_4_10_14_3_um_filter_44_21]PJB88467.1 MAG: hypothetical protein 
MAYRPETPDREPREGVIQLFPVRCRPVTPDPDLYIPLREAADLISRRLRETSEHTEELIEQMTKLLDQAIMILLRRLNCPDEIDDAKTFILRRINTPEAMVTLEEAITHYVDHATVLTRAHDMELAEEVIAAILDVDVRLIRDIPQQGSINRGRLIQRIQNVLAISIYEPPLAA